MNFDDVINNRFACRKFNFDKKISDDDLNKILNAGRIAPSAKNNQPTSVIVVRSDVALKLVDECTPCRYNAPVVLIVCGDKNIAWNKDEYSSFEMDASIFATHMILEATNIGLNNIWVRMFEPLDVQRKFNLEENVIPVCLIPIGYEDDSCPASPNHNNRKDLSEIVKFI